MILVTLILFVFLVGVAVGALFVNFFASHLVETARAEAAAARRAEQRALASLNQRIFPVA